jgi:predicted PurR-regulated permease PerM
MALIAVSLYILMPLADAIIMGLVTAYVLRILVDIVADILKRRVSEAVILSFFIALIAGGIYLAVSNVGNIGMEVVRLSQSTSSSIQTFLAPYDVPVLTEAVMNAITFVGEYLQAQLLEGVKKIPHLFLQFFTYFIVTLYAYKDAERIESSFRQLLGEMPERSAAVLEKVVYSITKLIRDVFVVYGLYGVILGVMGGFGFYVIGILVRGEPVAFAWAWGIVIGFAAFVEGLSTVLFTAPLFLYYVIVGQVWLAIWLSLYEMIVLFIVPEIFLLPYLGARRIEESFIVILLGFLAGPFVFGVKGLILGPVFIITLRKLLVMDLSPGTKG